MDNKPIVVSTSTGKQCPIKCVGEDTGGFCYWCTECGAVIDSGTEITFPSEVKQYYGDCEKKV